MTETAAYSDIHARSLAEPEAFWAEQAERLDWHRRWDKVLDRRGDPIPRWFVGGEINACHNCVDRHVSAGHGHEAALLYESPVTGVSRTVTFAELKEATARLGGAMRAMGVEKGDRVLVYMPNSPEAVIAMLACARIGAVHSVVFGGFAARELASRIDDAAPAIVIAASCGIEGAKVLPYQPILREALEIAQHRPDACIFRQREQHRAVLGEGEHDWDAVTAAAEPAECVPVAATDPLYILYTSGTTGSPKGIVRDTGGHLVTLLWSMTGIYACPPGEAFWAASDVGWVVGHSYICYAPLLGRNPSVVFEGKPVGTPDAGVFWRLIAKHRVRSFFTAPTALRAIRQVDPQGDFASAEDLSNLRTVFLAGERTDPATLAWTGDLLGVPVIDHWWQTETGSAITANPAGIELMPVKPGSSTLPMPGWDLACLDEDGEPVPAGTAGAIVARLPLPPGFTPGLWNAPERFREAYFERFEGCYLTGDSGFFDEDGYLHVMARIDDVINVAGHRLSSSAMEEVLVAHPAVAEGAVIGMADELKGQVPVGFVVLKAGSAIAPEDLAAELIAAMRSAIGPVAAFKRVHVLSRLPKTRSGKILRKTIREIADGEEPNVPPTIEDAGVLAEIEAIFA
ncbi:AMP-binding protein [Erythrobacter sp. HL-111]|uniref:AMP-binding protein n=1 Tax=Erythrobacter sp. HL-111 TaxID=1798193 RepID=UPI0006D9A076|nr:AMP-binding protein [Erythrobacter sp. HL-111]KPP96289.1 MAG: propionyl-CoA synthetase PrpE [Erythrobacteraceae bacterium HL-111]SDR74665.1 propionyl-CoA synthetase [Erythrobacter sp. HL-111]